MIYNIY